jgi:stage II sporulation protein AB (anti-sigma F factor)
MSKSSNVGLARLAVATFASELDFTLNELEEIKVAVSEAVTNSIIHGYPDKIGKIDIKAVLQPSYSTKQEHMGLGLAFIDSFVDQFELESSCGQGTDVTMNKKPVSLQKVAE